MQQIKNKSELEIEEILMSFDLILLPKYLSGIKNLNTLSKILHYKIKFGPAIYKFCNKLTDENFSFERFAKYQKYRTEKKTDAQSEMYYQLKYGDNWKEHYNLRQLSRGNPYNIEYYVSQGMTHTDAICKVNELKEKTTPSVEKYIKKYGENEGKKIFNEKCRRHKNYLEYWIKKCNGDISLAKQLFNEYTRLSSLKCIEFYTKQGYTELQAKELISKHQLTYAGVHRSYYENKGHTSNEIDFIIKQINLKKDSASINFIKQKYPNEDLLEFYENYNKVKSSRYREIGVLAKDDPFKSKRDAYYTAVRYYTRLNVQFLDECPGLPGKYKGNYHIDHIFSIDAGYRHDVDPKIIGSVVNLRWMLSEENTSKQQRCDIKLDELLRKYKDYENCKN